MEHENLNNQESLLADRNIARLDNKKENSSSEIISTAPFLSLSQTLSIRFIIL